MTTRAACHVNRWNERCAQILRRNEGKYHDEEMAALIEAATGMRFSPKTVQRHRLTAGLDACTRNTWTAPLVAYYRYITLEEAKELYA